MKVAVDTTYLLPVLGLAQENVPPDLLARLCEKGHEIFLNEISIFEAMAIGAKRCCTSGMEEEDVLTGVAVLASEDTLERIPLSEPEVCLRSILARRQIRDFVDCAVLATGAWAANILMTEDQEMGKYPVENLMPMHADFRVMNHRDAAKALDL